MKEHESQVPRRAVRNSPPLCILQSRFIVGQLKKLSIKVSRALTLVIEHELVITTICAYHYDTIVILAKRTHALRTARHLKFTETPTRAEVLWQERGGR